MSVGGDKKEKKDGEHITKSTLSVNRHILEWALARSRKSPDDLQSKFPKLSKWLKGESLTLHEVEHLAKETFTPLGFFSCKSLHRIDSPSQIFAQ